MSLAQEMYELTVAANKRITEERERQIREFPNTDMYADVMERIRATAELGEFRLYIDMEERYRYPCIAALTNDGFEAKFIPSLGEIQIKWNSLSTK